MEVRGPIEFTHSCGHRGVIECIATTQEHVDFRASHSCSYCRAKLAAKNLYGVALQYDIPDVLESEEDLPALELTTPEKLEITHLHCADCNQLKPVADLGLQLDGRRICDDCSELAQRIAARKRELEAEGQERLF